jgi:hypothetical protein
METLCLPTLPEPQTKPDGKSTCAQARLLVVSLGQPAAVDYVDFLCRQGQQHVSFVGTGSECAAVHPSACNYDLAELPGSALAAEFAALVIFIRPILTIQDRKVLNEVFQFAAKSSPDLLTIVSTFRVDLGDHRAAESEFFAVTRATETNARVCVFRAASFLSRHSQTFARLRRFGCFYPLIPPWIRGCCVTGENVFAAMENERLAHGARHVRRFTLLGPRVPWRYLLKTHRSRSFFCTCITLISSVLGLVQIGTCTIALLMLYGKRHAWWRLLNPGILRPCSFSELLTLYNKYSYCHLKVVGYNNGIRHFGRRYPGKTIVSTVGCHRIVRVGPKLKLDCGATVRQARDFLSDEGRELPVVPNFSYVCLGTSFFVPIHGSAAEASTIGETIHRVLLYDPLRDCVIRASRHDREFKRYAYNMHTEVLLLRLLVRTTPKSRYFVRHEAKVNPTAADLIQALKDQAAANVEIRKATAGNGVVTLSKYYKDRDTRPAQALELPRDCLGRLWDRLEENHVTAFLMHALTRHLAWHVELFFTEAEFAVFWQTHQRLPLRKLQVRYVRRDGLPLSPFRDHDCISVDLFMLRRHRRRFEAYLRESFAIIRANPGKHSA